MEEQIIRERYQLSMDRIMRFGDEKTVPEPFRQFFIQMAQWLSKIDRILKSKEDGSFASGTEEELRAENRSLYEDILPGNYETSYANPVYAVRMLGKELGPLLSFLYTEMRGDIIYAYENRILNIVFYNEALIEIYNLFEEEELPDEKAVHDVLYWCVSDYCDVTLTDRVQETLDPDKSFAYDIIRNADLSDHSYLYRFGEYVSDGMIRMADFLAGLSDEVINKMADAYTDGYIRGFRVMGCDLSKKQTVAIRYPLGFERMIRRAVETFEKAGLKVIIPRAAIDCVNRNPMGKNGYFGESANKQYDYDHRYDSAVFFDKAFRDRKLSVLRTAYEHFKDLALAYAGPAVIEIFGEEGFHPENHEEALAFNEKQRKLYLEYKNMSMPVVNEFIPAEETSFTIIAFPVPAIGKDFEEIFRETIKINTLDNALYTRLQQKLIDALDQADHVEVTGKAPNETKISVKLRDLEDPSRQTKFENCVSDVNIPAGEVFTSPRLTGTNGLLNVGKVYIGEICFRNLRLTFQDGRVQSLSCDNFLREGMTEEEQKAAEAEGRKLILEVITNQHEHLPMGEFAIGTNTTAYAMAEKYQILDRLPILIAEKMGPHFAVGDTCYSWAEDSPMYNPDGKEMIARDNEISILRKEDVSKAYFGVHTDITIPYKELGRIDAVRPDGTRITLIDEGRFVLNGLEELNLPL